MLGAALLTGAACGQAPTAIRVGTTTTPEGSTTPPSAEPSTTVGPTTSTTAEPQPVVEPEPTTVYVAPVTTRRTTTTAYVPYEPAGDLAYGEWAIPAYIVMCESGGHWNAYNQSGASGPYQIMPMHFDGELAMNQSRAAQHAMAAKLWAGGAGRSHWAACL